MKIRFWIIAIAGSLAAGGLSGQVTIGSGNEADRAKLLHIESHGGLGLPRVQLVSRTTLEPFVATSDTEWQNAAASGIKEKHTGLMVYNVYASAASVTDSDKKFKPGAFVWDGAKWAEAGSGGKRWFYMPAFNLPLEAVGQTYTFDLYAEYEKQFTRSGNSLFTSNPLLSTAATVPSPETGQLYGKRALDYAVVQYDNAIIDVTGIDNDGIMTYEVLDNDPGSTSFMTVVFIIKE